MGPYEMQLWELLPLWFFQIASPAKYDIEEAQILIGMKSLLSNIDVFQVQTKQTGCSKMLLMF